MFNSPLPQVSSSSAQSRYRLIWRLYALLLLSIPFSVTHSFGSFSLELPSEPLMILLCVLLLPTLKARGKDGLKMMRNPLLLVSALWLVWMAVGIPFSSDPIVSTKYTVVAATHWFLFAYVPVLLPLPPLKATSKWLNYYAISILVILLLAWSVHAQYDFRIDASVLVARPFFFDHALLSTSLLLLLGIYVFSSIQFLFAIFRTTPNRQAHWKNSYPLFLSLLFSLGVYLAFSRAAWLSTIIAIIVLGVVGCFKHFFRYMLGLSILTFVLLLLLSPMLWQEVQNNRIESKKGTWWEQIVSSANISTDVSNLERLNRYSCAYRMFLDRPLLGFGVGTFETAYLSYQRPEEMTRISVTTPGPHPPGRGGGAHSEYFQALSEMGLLGILLFMALALLSCWTAIRVYWTASLWEHRYLALALLFGLLTYFVHGFFNNFFHHSKIAILVWSSMAILINLKQ
ncbi:MAG: O-antigen ligase family protein, partial [Bacteroidota bacterium]